MYMIKSFKHKGLEQFFISGSKKGIQPEHSGKLARILDRLDSSINVKDMAWLVIPTCPAMEPKESYDGKA